MSLAWRRLPTGAVDFALMLDDLIYVVLALIVVAMLVVVYLLSKNQYQRTLRAHASRFFASANKLRHRQQNFLGSMQAEEKVFRVLQEEGWRHTFLRRRVPISRLGHNREIDVIGVGNIVLVVEVKNWRGYVWSNGSSWFQAARYDQFLQKQKRCGAKARRDGYVPAPSTVEFENVLEDNVLKAAALRRYIENTQRIALPDFSLIAQQKTFLAKASAQADGADNESDVEAVNRGTRYSDESLHKNCGLSVVPVVVFTHPSVRLDPDTLERESHVFTLDTFRVFARETLRGNVSAEAPTAVLRRTNKLLSFCAYHLRTLLRTAPLLGRWLTSSSPQGYLLDEQTQDSVAHAVDVLRTWDLVFLHDGNMITGDVVKVEAPSAGCMYERKHLLDVNVKWNSSAIVGFIKTFLLNEAGYVELVLTTAKRLAVKRNESKPRTAQGNIRFPLLAKNTRNLNLNDRIIIKPAGSAGQQMTYALADVKEIQLSHHLYESEKLL